MKYLKTAMVVAIALAAVVMVLPMEDSDGDVRITSGIEYKFDTLSGGSITIPISSSYSETFTAHITVTEGSKTVFEGDKEISRDTESINLSMPGFKSEGYHTLEITFSTDNPYDYTFNPESTTITVHVDSNVLSNWSTYLIIIIAVIAIVVVVYLKMRDTPKDKPTMTFEELEEERKAKMAAKSDKRSQKSEAPSTERKKYTGRKKE
ncbi:MAG: hypothetical protein SPF21_00770 [Candidatus Methanomethylophilaceae archaeon]|nr:hypothetical protein [Candidatus Methanomethylophilaceae archaeon]